MGMRIGGGQQAWSSQSSSVSNWQQRQQNFKALGSALQTGDLTGAQQAFATITANNPAAANNPSSPLAQIGQALQSGNLAGAQQAAQTWRGQHGGGAAQANASDAASAFLKTLTPLTSNTPTASTADTSATTSGTPTADQMSQALMAFERNLFDSLQAQNSATTTTPSTSSPAASPAAATASAAPATASAAGSAPAQGVHHHHHHGGGGGDAQLAAELNALIAQTASSAATGTATATAAATATVTATDPAASAATSTTALDQSFKNLLQTLGVTGNNASLNSFLQAMSANVQAA